MIPQAHGPFEYLLTPFVEPVDPNRGKGEKNVTNRAEQTVLRGLYTEIGMIEEQHVSH